nr:MAG TPA: hypothetical protein [Caudoviricetes sp.]
MCSAPSKMRCKASGCGASLMMTRLGTGMAFGKWPRRAVTDGKTFLLSPAPATRTRSA